VIRAYNIFRNLPVAFIRIPLLFIVILVDLLSIPFQVIEKMIYGTKIKKETIDPNPVFIIGHWRSGTTFLHQLLRNDPQFGYINFYRAMFPNSFLLTENIVKPILNKLSLRLRWKIPFFNNIPYDFDFPCEEDTALLNMGSSNSAYWAYALPKKAIAMFSHTMYFDSQDAKTEKAFMDDYLCLLRKISLKCNGKRLLLKSPPNTTRIQLLLTAFPKAKFIYLERNAVDIYYSHAKLWRQCLKQYGLQKITQAQLDHIIIQTMKNMQVQYNKDKSLLNSGNLYEVNYEKLINDPLSTIREIYQNLEIPGFSDAEMPIRKQINKSKKYAPFSYQYSAEKIRWVKEKITA
jgi:hypothetical protein